MLTSLSEWRLKSRVANARAGGEPDSSSTILVISYEFTYSPFSGNGVLARSLVKGLLACGLRVLVICAKPADEHAGQDNPIAPPDVTAVQDASLMVVPVPLPAAKGWQRLDSRAAHEEFAHGAVAAYEALKDPAITSFTAAEAHGPSFLHLLLHVDAVVAIDWTGGGAWAAMRRAFMPTTDAQIPNDLPTVYVNFRVYSSGLPAASEPPPAWYDAKEQAALATASRVLALSTRDQASLRALLGPSAPTTPVEVMLPCLRGDMQALSARSAEAHAEHLPPAAAAALAAAGGPGTRCFVACVVRLSAEKRAMHFAELLEAIGAQQLAGRKLVPLLCGAAAEPEYAAECVARVRAASGGAAVVLQHRLGPEEMAAVFSASALNVHPCTYDAYGMSVVEAAAFGAPSLVHGGDAVGAVALLRSDGCVEADLGASAEGGVGAEATARRVLAALDDGIGLRQIAERGRERALGWSEAAAGRALRDHLEAARAHVRARARPTAALS